MGKKFRRIISVILCLVMFSSIGVYADEGSDGENALQQNSEIIYSDEDVIVGSDEADMIETDEDAAVEEYYLTQESTEPAVQSIETRDAAVKVEVETANAAGWFLLTASGINIADGGHVEADVWSSNGGKDDIYTYTAVSRGSGVYIVNNNISRHSYDTGEYNFEVYTVDVNGVRTLVGSSKTEFTMSKGTMELQKTSSGYKVAFSGIEVPGGLQSVRYAVWSDAGWQDDLKWYRSSFNASAGTASVSYNSGDFNTYGKYYVDVYGVSAVGKNVYLGGTTYNIDPLKASSIDVETDNPAGWFKVTVNGLPSSGISKVQVAIWSVNGGQDDLVWYTAQKQSNGSYIVNKNLSQHAYDTGAYNFHVYATTTDGYYGCVGTAKTEFTVSSGAVSAGKTSNGYKISVSDIEVPGGLKSVRYAVWSDEGWQDDLKWFEGTYSNRASSVTYKDTDFNTYGKYYVDVYGTNVTGKSIYLGGTTYTIKAPSAESVNVSTNNAAGQFTVKVNGLVSDSGISKVQVGVWNEKNGQDDLTWYTLQKQNDGSYAVASTLSKHDYLTGKYNFHVYVWNANGAKTCVGTGKAEFTTSSSGVSVKAATENVKYTASVSNVVIPGGVKGVRFAVWSVKGGQDDLKWYDASLSGNTYSASFNIFDHKTEGVYYVDAYARTATGKQVCLGGYYKTEVKVSADASISVSAGSKEGTFNAYVTVNSASPSVSSVKVAVWSNTSWQDDLKWYTATKQSDGRYMCTFKAEDHKHDVGKYYIDSNAVYSNGVEKYVCGTTISFDPVNYLYVQKTGNGQRDIVIKNVPSGTTKVEFAVWSNTNGQDDLKWYTATKQSDGSYKLSLHISDFKNAGTFTVHTYRNGNRTNPYFLKATTFTADSSELGKTGWYYENGYKFYYINNVKQTDVRSILGAQSTYRIEVNRTCNTITIYAKDGSNGYIIPVVAFACSVGLPATPTYPGNYTVGAKYRWKMLMGPSYGQYVSQVVGQSGVYFHSVAGSNMTSYNLSATEYNKLGSAASHGCIRLNVRDAKWIYDNVPTGSSIYIYDSSTPGPLGKPATIKIPAGQTWDPTDPAITG